MSMRLWRIEYRRDPGRWALADLCKPKSAKKKSLPCCEGDGTDRYKLGLYTLISYCLWESKGAAGVIEICHPTNLTITLHYEHYRGKYGSGIDVFPPDIQGDDEGRR